jgi:hypothetical protein
MPNKLTISPGEIGPGSIDAAFTTDAMSGGVDARAAAGVTVQVTGTVVRVALPGGDATVTKLRYTPGKSLSVTHETRIGDGVKRVPW